MNGDDLSQWRGYSGGSGFAVALDPHVPLAVCGDRVPTMGRLIEWPMVEWRPVVYDPAEKSRLMAHVAQFIAASTPAVDNDPDGVMERRTVATVLESVARLKHHGFEPEQEVRLLVGESRLQEHVQVRPGGFGPTPFVEMCGVDDETLLPYGVQLLATDNPGTLPILEVAIGPAQDQGVAEGGVRSLLRTLGREEILVSRSEVPYR
jgi:hypothetical protein